MKWIALVLAVFLIYSIFFAMVVLFLGEPVPVYYVTLFINWWSPTGFGSGIFGIVIYQRWKQWSDLWKEDEWEAGQASSGAEELTSKVSVDVRVPRDYTENQAYSAPVSVTQPPFAPITTSQSYGQQQYSQQQYSQQSRPYPQSGPYSPTVSVPPNAVSYGGSYFGAPPATAYGSPTSPTSTYATSPTRQVDVTPRRGGRNDGYQPSDVHPGWNGGEQNHHRY
ncbi:hypothetical protein BC829DRAFT_403991 [Chytridium lagenaria]|nr:hypothetical protein BC829DRAFT_403991 [Chytridium lagenaria]